MDEPRRAEADRADVVALPPLLYLGAVVGGVAAKWLVGGAIAPGSALRVPVGALLLAMGVVLEVWFSWALKQTGQNVRPDTPTPSIISTGPFRFSRNPAYVGMVAVVAGIGCMLDNPWVILALLPVLVVMHYGVILREEAYLERKFGDEYLRYKAAVRRWL